MAINNGVAAAAVLLVSVAQPVQHFSAADYWLVQNAADPVQAAESLLEKQQYDQAEARLQSLTASHPRNPQVWFDLGFAQSHLGKTQDAISAYKKAVELSPKWFEAQMNLGVALAKAGNFAEAARPLGTAVQLKPTTGGQQALTKAWTTLAEVLEHTDEKQAANAYQQAMKLDPSNADPVLALGKLQERSGDAVGAEQQYLKAAQMNGGQGVEQLIDFYLRQKRLPEAESWLKKYLSGKPQDYAAQAQLGRVLMAEDKTQEAITSLEASGSAAQDPAVARVLAGLYVDNKQYDQASTLLQQLLQKTPADGGLHAELGDCLLHLHKYPEAEAELIKAVNLNPKLADSYWQLAYAADQNKHYVLALRALNERAHVAPESAATYWLRATSYDNLGAYKMAAQNYKLFLAASAGKSPDQEFQARHRLKAIEPH